MLPVIPAAENMQQSTRKAPKRDQRPKLLARSYELASFGRPPTTDTESIIIEPQEEYTSKSSEPAVHHHRGLSLHIDWSLDDVKDLVDQLYDGTIVDVKLSLLAFWIKEKEENYQLARGLIRELGVDQVCYSVRLVPGFSTNNTRDTTLTGFPTYGYAGYCKKFTIFDPGPYPRTTSWPA
jgi:hypothetical protein